MMFLNKQKSQYSLIFVLELSMFLVNFQRAYGFHLISTTNHGRITFTLREQRPTYRVMLGASTLTESTTKGVASLEPEDDEHWDLLRPSETMEVQIEKTKRKLGLTFDLVGEDIIVYSIADSALPEVKEKLEKGDNIISVNGIKYTTHEDMAKGIRDISVGETVTLTILSRANEALEIKSEDLVADHFDFQTQSEQLVAEPFIAEVENEIKSEDLVADHFDFQTQSEEAVAEPFIAEVEKEIKSEEPVADHFDLQMKSEEPVADHFDFKTQSEETVAEPFFAEVENEIGNEESVPETTAESNIKPSGSMKFTITKPSDLLGITFYTEEGVIKVYDINTNAVESVAKNFQVGDTVLAMNDLKYTHDAKLATSIREIEIGDTMIFDILRVPQAQSEEPLAEPTFAENENEIGIEKSVPQTTVTSDINKAQGEEPPAEPTFADNKNEIGFEESVPETSVTSDINKEETNAKQVAAAKEGKAPVLTSVKSVLKIFFSKLEKLMKLLRLADFVGHIKKALSSQS